MFFFFNDTATTEIYTLSLHDALPISPASSESFSSGVSCCSSRSARAVGSSERSHHGRAPQAAPAGDAVTRSEEHTFELQSQFHLVCRLLLEKKKKQNKAPISTLPIDK